MMSLKMRKMRTWLKTIKEQNSLSDKNCEDCGKQLVKHETLSRSNKCYKCRYKDRKRGYLCDKCGIITNYPDLKSFYTQYKYYETKILKNKYIMDFDELICERNLHKDYCPKYSRYIFQYNFYIKKERCKSFFYLKKTNISSDIMRFIIMTFI